jgi:hypothetical protein
LLEEDSLLRRLEEALSEEEIRRVVASSLLVLDDASRKRLLARIAPETAAALIPALDPPRKPARSQKAAMSAAGKGKLRQEWDRLWQEWTRIVDESGAETGDYVHQDADWEPPYIDTYSIGLDLDAVAAKMRSLIPRVIAEGIDPGFSFAQAIREMDEGLYAGQPDWVVEGIGEDCCLGPKATTCLLEWEWKAAQGKGRDAAAFLDEIRDLQTGLQKVGLDGQAIKTFVRGLSHGQRQSLLASLERQRLSPRWAEAFTRAYGCWAEILRDLSKRWKPELHVEISRANIAQDWTLALPLVEDAVKRKAFAEAIDIIDEALRSRLRLDGTERWNPCKELLVEREVWHHGDEQSTKLATLLHCWMKAAHAQKQPELAAALALQIAALRHAEDGETMLKAFHAFPAQFHAIRDRLFAAWRELIVRRTLDTWRDSDPVPCGGWVSALVDAAWAGTSGVAIFHAAVRVALDESRKKTTTVPRAAWNPRWAQPTGQEKSLRALAILTRDLDATLPTMKKLAPRLWHLLSKVDSDARKRVSTTRRNWCKSLGGKALIPKIVAFWREDAVRFVPDPGASTAEYSESADWLAAVHEINPAAASKLRASWATVYHLKRNLWRDLAQRGFPIPPGVRGGRASKA